MVCFLLVIPTVCALFVPSLPCHHAPYPVIDVEPVIFDEKVNKGPYELYVVPLYHLCCSFTVVTFLLSLILVACLISAFLAMTQCIR